MAHIGPGVFSTMLVLFASAVPADGQSVISTRSGLVHFFEGTVYLNGQPMESRLGRFPSVLPGAELRTEQGWAEVLLTPGFFLRMGKKSAIRMLKNDLADTQVELSYGSVILQGGNPDQDTSVSITYGNWKVHFPQKGRYRIDSEPPCLWVLQGTAEVVKASGGEPIEVQQGMDLPFAPVLVPEQSTHHPDDALTDWAIGRTQSIIADNAIMAQIDEDPADQAPGLDNFTYFPVVGLFSVGVTSPYSSIYPYQPGFNSIYLPGYTYTPFWLGTMGRGFHTYSPPLHPSRGGGSFGVGTYPRPSFGPPRGGVSPGVGTSTPYPRPPIARPIPIHPAPHAGGAVHSGGHR